MSYTIKEVFLTLQGEGVHAGRRAVFCRFAGCNLWSGREADRATAVCSFCDTDFVGADGSHGGRYADAERLADTVLDVWERAVAADERAWRSVVLTGGEPLLQVDAALVAALHRRGFWIAIETNGTLPAPDGIDWICVSPKLGAPLRQRRGDELKLAYPQGSLDPAEFTGLDFASFRLQPIDGPALADNTSAAIAYCMAHPRWRLGVQTHKMLGLR